MPNAKALAYEVSRAFVTDKRNDGTEFVKLRDGSPEWMTDLCRHAHGEMCPDDWRYRIIEDACDALAESDDWDDVTIEPSIYTHELLSWICSRIDRNSYCDDALADSGSEFPGTVELLQLGQAREKEEVLSFVRQFLEDKADDDGTDDE